MQTYRAVDVQGFAGGFSLGMVQAGFDLVAKRELPGGFGAKNMDANRPLLGNYDYQEGDWSEWEPVNDAHVVFGNPPCSGFSPLSSPEFRGIESKINHCMHALIDYASKMAPPIVMFECVQQGFTQGRPLMLHLREKLERQTGKRYDLWHVKHNALSVGGAGMRKRYFMVASQVPFGVDEHFLANGVPTMRHVIGDLRAQPLSWSTQPYASNDVSRWAQPKRGTCQVVDGHAVLENATVSRVMDLIGEEPWAEGESISDVARRYFTRTGSLPKSYEKKLAKLVDNDFYFGFYCPHRWKWNEPARVITGSAMAAVLHPTEPRFLTHRECARIMGFPDSWVIEPMRDDRGLHATWGKGITVECGRWIGTWALSSLEGAPGEIVGGVIGDRERLIDLTYSFRRALAVA